MTVRMIPSITQDGDVRFELYEMPTKALVGRFTVSDAPTGSSMAANGVFCTREMVVTQPIRGFFAARKDKKKGISEPYALRLEMMPVARIYLNAVELEKAPFNIITADFCGDIFHAYPVGMGNAGVKIPVFLERENGEIPTALIEKPYTRDTTLQEYAVTGGNRAYEAFAITMALYDFMLIRSGVAGLHAEGSTFTVAPQLTQKYDDWCRITHEYWGATG